MTTDEVVAVLGTPSSRYASSGRWYYDTSCLQFDGDRLVAVSDTGNLRVKPDVKAGDDLRTGMTKAEVLSAIGMPTSVFNHGAKWKYGRSALRFDGDRLIAVDDKGKLYREPDNSTDASNEAPPAAENGDIRDADNDGDGRPEPVFVQGYFRKDGTYVRSHYRAAPDGGRTQGASQGSSLGTRRSAATTPSSSGSVRVRGYYRRDGTFVRPHSRSRPRRG